MQWAPNENVTTYFYKVSRTQGTKTAAMQGTGIFQHFWQRAYLSQFLCVTRCPQRFTLNNFLR
jgi:hypothetical protein